MILCSKDISKEGFLFNDNVKIINVSLKFLIKVPTQNVANLKSFWNLYTLMLLQN